MSYNSLIDANLRRAFKLVKDQARDIGFIKTVSSSFDFNTANASSQTVPVTSQAIVIDIKQPSKGSNLVIQQLMVRAEGIEDIKAYDTVNFDELVWKLTRILKGNGHILIIEISREK